MCSRMFSGGEDVLNHSPLFSSSGRLILDQSVEFLPDQELLLCFWNTMVTKRLVFIINNLLLRVGRHLEHCGQSSKYVSTLRNKSVLSFCPNETQHGYLQKNELRSRNARIPANTTPTLENHFQHQIWETGLSFWEYWLAVASRCRGLIMCL